MKILALEFSSDLRSAAIALDSGQSRNILASVQDPDFRGVTALTLIDRAFREAQLKPADIEHVVVGLGPGSYTGIRTAIAIAQGWQLARDVSVSGISSARCLAEEARRKGNSGEVTLVFDAQRGDVYLQKFVLDAQRVIELEPLRIEPRSSIPPNSRLIGPEASKFRTDGVDLSPAAVTLAHLADTSVSLPAEQLEPIYLREIAFVKAPPSRHIS